MKREVVSIHPFSGIGGKLFFRFELSCGHSRDLPADDPEARTLSDAFHAEPVRLYLDRVQTDCAECEKGDSQCS